MILRTHSSVIIVVLIACVAIAVFIMFFWSNLKWEQNEQRYEEIKLRLDKTADDATETSKD
jgi:flagellar basal body-associated protein FliL